MTPIQRVEYISNWIKNYAREYDIQTLVVGISGGIDSSVVSILCARTSMPTLAVVMPIRQSAHTHDLSQRHGQWLASKYPNARVVKLELTPVFESFEKVLGSHCASEQEPTPSEQLAWANSRARLRMMSLYQIAQSHNGIVVGTGNRVEDFGVGFFTKYGDGGVDISPIGDCLKTQVWAMGRELAVLEDIQKAAPTDGLWADGRTDEDQLGMSYSDLEAAMLADELDHWPQDGDNQNKIQTYRQIRRRNLHKMTPIPVCKMPAI